jgi:hypothetical protein
MEIKTFDEIYDSMRNYVITHQNRITDFNDGSVMSSFIEACAREFALLYIRARVGFSSYLRGLPYSVFNFTKKPGEKASARVVFSRAAPAAYAANIPAGTIVASGGLRFLTTEPGDVPSGGTDSQSISVIAENAGEKYNVGARTVKTVESVLTGGIVAVDNAEAAAGGSDDEDWQAYIDRFGDYILGLQRTNFYGFKHGLLGSGLVRSLSVEEHFPPLDGIWNMTVYLEDGSGGMTSGAIAAVKKIIDGDRTAGNGGCRAPGISVRYLAPEKIPVGLRIEVATARDVTNEIDESVVVYEVGGSVKKFVNSLEIGKPVLVSDIIVMLKSISYIDDVKPLGPAGNVAINTRQIARFESCDVTVVVQ